MKNDMVLSTKPIRFGRTTIESEESELSLVIIYNFIFTFYYMPCLVVKQFIRPIQWARTVQALIVQIDT